MENKMTHVATINMLATTASKVKQYITSPTPSCHLNEGQKIVLDTDFENGIHVALVVCGVKWDFGEYQKRSQVNNARTKLLVCDGTKTVLEKEDVNFFGKNTFEYEDEEYVLQTRVMTALETFVDNLVYLPDMTDAQIHDMVQNAEMMVNNFGFDAQMVYKKIEKSKEAENALEGISREWVNIWGGELKDFVDGRNEYAIKYCIKLRNAGIHEELPEYRNADRFVYAWKNAHKTLQQTFAGLVFVCFQKHTTADTLFENDPYWAGCPLI